MPEYDLIFQALHKKFNTKFRMHPWTTAQLNYSKVKLLSRKHLGEKTLDRISPLLAVSEELTRFAGLRPLYEGINLLDPVYCCIDKACFEKN